MAAATPSLPSPRLKIWFALAVAVNLIALAATQLVHRPAVAYAAAFDVAVTVPTLYYFLVVRAGAQPALTILPLAVLALVRATYVAPGAAALRPAVAALAEVVVIGFLVTRVRRGLRAGDGRGDVLERVRLVALEMVRVPALAHVLTSEVAVFYYALAWRPKPHVPPDARAFTVHRETGVGVWFACLAGVSAIEATVIHLLIASSSAVAAWVATALSAYGCVWLVAVGRSFALRPVLVTADALEIRSGMIASLLVPRSSIASAVSIADAGEQDWRAIPLSAPNVRVTFTAPALAHGMYGRKKVVTRVALAVDDPRAFLEALAPPA